MMYYPHIVNMGAYKEIAWALVWVLLQVENEKKVSVSVNHKFVMDDFSFSVREQAVFYQFCNRIGCRSGRYSSGRENTTK